jgi:phosphocarrier protein HPr
MTGSSPGWPRRPSCNRQISLANTDAFGYLYSEGRMTAKKLADHDLVMTKDFLVSNKLGIHARPAAMFVKIANRFSCDIFVEKDGEKVNGKSIMGLMMLAAGPGSKLTVSAQGQDAPQALAELETLVKRKFDEE